MVWRTLYCSSRAYSVLEKCQIFIVGWLRVHINAGAQQLTRSILRSDTRKQHWTILYGKLHFSLASFFLIFFLRITYSSPSRLLCCVWACEVVRLGSGQCEERHRCHCNWRAFGNLINNIYRLSLFSSSGEFLLVFFFSFLDSESRLHSVLVRRVCVSSINQMWSM